MKLTPKYDFNGWYTHISTHDKRPTAPNGTLWNISAVNGEMADIWTINALGTIYEETVNIKYLTEVDGGIR